MKTETKTLTEPAECADCFQDLDTGGEVTIVANYPDRVFCDWDCLKAYDNAQSNQEDPGSYDGRFEMAQEASADCQRKYKR